MACGRFGSTAALVLCASLSLVLQGCIDEPWTVQCEGECQVTISCENDKVEIVPDKLCKGSGGKPWSTATQLEGRCSRVFALKGKYYTLAEQASCAYAMSGVKKMDRQFTVAGADGRCQMGFSEDGACKLRTGQWADGLKPQVLREGMKGFDDGALTDDKGTQTTPADGQRKEAEGEAGQGTQTETADAEDDAKEGPKAKQEDAKEGPTAEGDPKPNAKPLPVPPVRGTTVQDAKEGPTAEGDPKPNAKPLPEDAKEGPKAKQLSVPSIRITTVEDGAKEGPKAKQDGAKEGPKAKQAGVSPLSGPPPAPGPALAQ